MTASAHPGAGPVGAWRRWRDRARQRGRLRALDDRLLDDVGLTRAQADREAAKPFWRD